MTLTQIVRYLDDREATQLGLSALARIGDLALGVRTDWTTWGLGVELHVEPYPEESDHVGSLGLIVGPFELFAQVESPIDRWSR